MAQAQSVSNIINEREFNNTYDHIDHKEFTKVNTYDHRDNHMKQYRCGRPLNPHHRTVEQVDQLVDYLLTKFKDSSYTPIFRKICWQLPERQIHFMVESATMPNIQTPIAYFIRSAKRCPDYRC